MASYKILRDGCRSPTVGLGTYLCGERITACALEGSYRLIDTASYYDNEAEVGRAIRNSGIPRDQIFTVTKVWNTDHGRSNTLKAFEDSLDRLGLEYVDLYLMHSAMGGRTLETWDAMVELREKGCVKSVGVANFNVHHLRELQKARPDNIPMVNQIELHPFLAWDDCVEFCRSEDIAVMAYSPLAQANKMNDKTLYRMAQKYSKSPAQIMIRWSVQQGYICIPRTSRQERLSENINVFDFEISKEDMEILNKLDEHYISDWPGAMDSKWVP